MKVINELQCKVRVRGVVESIGAIEVTSAEAPVGSFAASDASHVAIVVGTTAFVVDGLELIAATQNALRVR